ncbi:MAG: hypothetical protein D6773_10390 [Alphaproteobacteria bacterium]|nr:MAG: hypothetical protein D6773_10390 [Alphaproteobacteria bacterium]
MASSFRLRRFSSPHILKQIARPLLLRFFHPHRAFFTARGVALNPSVEVDYDAIAEALMRPGEDTPEKLLDALYFVDELSAPEMYEDLLELARTNDVRLAATPDLSCADLAVRIWLDNADALQRYHAERFAVRTKRFEYYPSIADSIPRFRLPADSILQSLQDDLNVYFETQKKGRGTRVFVFPRDDIVWFLIRHGERIRREGALDGEKSSGIFYRPEKFDVAIYDPALCELAIHAETKGEKRAYCTMFGKHIFRNPGLFDVETNAKFTLMPILALGPQSLACADVEGMERVRLVELQWRHDISRYFVEIQKSDDVFAALAEIARAIPRNVDLLKAVFKIKFNGSDRERRVAIKPPNAAVFERDSDSPLVHEWLARRGFTLRLVPVVGNVS